MATTYEVKKVGEENHLWEHSTGEREGEVSSRFVGVLDELQVAKHEVAVREQIAIKRTELADLELKLARVLDWRAQLVTGEKPVQENEQ
jgi:hypothetical protein